MIVWNTFEHDARVLKEAETLTEAGHQVTVHALHTPGVTRQREVTDSGVRIVRVLRSPGMLLRGRGALRSNAGAAPSGGPVTPAAPPRGPGRVLLRVLSRGMTHVALLWRMLRARPDVVHAHDVNTLATGWLAARLCGAGLVYDAHEISTDREGYRAVRSLVYRVESRLLPAADAVITTTGLRARFFARAYGVRRPLVLQNRPRYSAPPRSRCLREQLGLTEDWPVVLYQGGLQPGRGLEDLVRVAARVERAYFVFIGGGRLARRLTALAATLELSDRVHFLPTVPLAALPSYTAAADIGVQPLRNTCLNHWSTDSNKLFEYIMAGLPVVASDFPEIRRVVQAHDVGLLFDPETLGALEAAIRRLVEHADLRGHYRRNALACRRALSWEAQEPALVRLYEHLLGEDSDALPDPDLHARITHTTPRRMR